MKPLPILFISLLLVSWFSVGQQKVIKACGHHDYAPWNWLQDGEIVGVCAELVNELYENMGYAVDLTYVGPWKRCQKLVELGEVDVNICALKNTTRSDYSTFTDVPMAYNQNAVFVRKDSDLRVSQLSDLKGKIVGMVRGVSLGTEIDSFLHDHTNLILVENYTRLFRILDLKRIDGLIVGRESGLSHIRLLNLSDSITDLPFTLVNAELYISVSNQSAFLDTLPAINDMLMSSGYLEAHNGLFKKYQDAYFNYKGLSVTPPLELSLDEQASQPIEPADQP